MHNSCFTKTWQVLMPLLLMAMVAGAQSRDGWYKVLTGQLGRYTGTLHLHKSARSFSGYLWLQENQYPMPFQYKVTASQPDSLRLTLTNRQQQVTLAGIFLEEIFSGTCSITGAGGATDSLLFKMEESNSADFTRFNYYYTAAFTHLPRPYNHHSSCSYKLAAIWPVDNNINSELHKKQVQKFFGITTTVDEIGTWMMDEKDRYIGAWKKEHTKKPPADAASGSLSFSLEEEINIMVMYENKNFISLAKYNFGSSGGGRGFYSTDIATINKLSGKPVSLKDLLKPAGIAALPALLDKTARQHFGIRDAKPLDQHGFLKKRMLPGEHFYITETGIGFLFPPASIKPFAVGEINLLIPFALLKAYLQPGVAVLLSTP